jgi:hypothetical protein
MSAAKKKGRAPIALHCQTALRTGPDLPRNNPGRVSLVAVASVLAGYADSTGRNCYPSIETIMREAGVSKRTARLCLAVFVDVGWLKVTHEATHRWPTVYELTYPRSAEEHRSAEVQGVPRSTPWKRSGGAAEGAAGHPNLLPPTMREDEEEGANARSAIAALAAPPLDLFSDDTAPAEAEASTAEREGPSAPLAPALVVIARDIAEQTGRPIDARRLAPALAGAQARSGGWSDEKLAAYCVEPLLRMGDKVHDPSAFLVTHLGRVSDGTQFSPRRQRTTSDLREEYADDPPDYADLREQYGLLRQTLDNRWGLAIDQDDDDDAVWGIVDRLEGELVEIGVLGDDQGWEECPSPAEVNESQLELIVSCFQRARDSLPVYRERQG